jgi:ketosteroid isomerase-like protein
MSPLGRKADAGRITVASRNQEHAVLKIVRVVRRVHPALATLIVAGTLAACQAEERQQAEAVTSAAEASRAAIDRLRAEYEKAVAASDFDAMSALLAEGAVMIRPGAPDWKSMEAAAGGAPFPRGATIDIKPIEVVVLNKEWAYEFGTSITTYTPEGADGVQQLRDTYLILLRNSGDGWKAYREVASSSPPPNGWPQQ